MQVGEDEFYVSAEFPEDLPARSAGRREEIRIGHYGCSYEFSGAFGNGLEDGHTFGADGEAVGCVFHVAAGVDAAGLVFYRGSDFEVRVGRVGVFAGFQSCGDKGIGYQILVTP